MRDITVLKLVTLQPHLILLKLLVGGNLAVHVEVDDVIVANIDTAQMVFERSVASWPQNLNLNAQVSIAQCFYQGARDGMIPCWIIFSTRTSRNNEQIDDRRGMHLSVCGRGVQVLSHYLSQ